MTPLKYGDAVVLVQKSRDGSITRVNAIVLAAMTAGAGSQLKLAGQVLPEAQYVDLAFPVPGFPAHQASSKPLEEMFRKACAVPPWQEEAWIGYESPASDEPAPVFETKQYADGSSATGVAPLPNLSPDEQAKLEAVQASGPTDDNAVNVNGAPLPTAADLDAVAADQQAADATAGEENPPTVSNA